MKADVWTVKCLTSQRSQLELLISQGRVGEILKGIRSEKRYVKTLQEAVKAHWGTVIRDSNQWLLAGSKTALLEVQLGCDAGFAAQEDGRSLLRPADCTVSSSEGACGKTDPSATDRICERLCGLCLGAVRETAVLYLSADQGTIRSQNSVLSPLQNQPDETYKIFSYLSHLTRSRAKWGSHETFRSRR